MPWVRIDENAMDHPKFLALTDGAWRLWCEGQGYCQKHLTDGVIPRAALRGFRYYSPSRLKNLLAENVPGKGPCWHQYEDGTVHVHDYLVWNDSRDVVLKAREGANERRRRSRERHTSSDGELPTNGTASVPSGVLVDWDLASRGESREGQPDDVSLRAGRFCQEVYPALYAKHRKGARYVGRPALDFQEALLLCRTWPDDRLVKLAHVFLTTDHQFAEQGSRTMAQFRALASWCDSQLTERGL